MSQAARVLCDASHCAVLRLTMCCVCTSRCDALLSYNAVLCLAHRSCVHLPRHMRAMCSTSPSTALCLRLSHLADLCLYMHCAVVAAAQPAACLNLQTSTSKTGDVQQCNI
jgi:hypothetical protein